MPSYSKRSKERLETCDARLQRLFNEVIKEWDCTILCGHRGKEEQDEAFRQHRSKVQWPNGKHNSLPSRAVDVMPCPIDWHDIARLEQFANFVIRKADELGIRVRWGGDWNQNGTSRDERFFDGPHFELIGD